MLIKLLCSIYHDVEKKEVISDELLLFTTATCPNCRMAKMILDQKGIKYKVIDANENQELCIKLGIKGAPTLLVPTNGHYVAYSNASEIKGFAENLVK